LVVTHETRPQRAVPQKTLWNPWLDFVQRSRASDFESAGMAIWFRGVHVRRSAPKKVMVQRHRLVVDQLVPHRTA
jgi:hypothetical protein